jgi:Asp-tRNA(Asn)/Glu-tRNA(Gln) amidotransferase A subunit family amidase
VRRAADALVSLGAARGGGAPFGPKEGMDVWTAVMHETGIAYDDIVAEGRVPLLKETLKYLAGRSDHAGGVIAILALQRYVPVGRFAGTPAARALIARLEGALGPKGVLLAPVYTKTAPKHRGMAFNNPFDTGCTAAFNATTSPVTVIRVGEDADGMPIGVQIVGRRGADALTLGVGVALERALGGWAGPVGA